MCLPACLPACPPARPPSCCVVCARESVCGMRATQELELPYPLQKDAGEKEDAWIIKDLEGTSVLKLRFALEHQ